MNLIDLFHINRPFWSFNRPFWSFNRPFRSLYWSLIEKDQFYMEIKIIDWILSLDFEWNRNRRSNSDFRFNSTTTIRLATPYRITLVVKVQFKIWWFRLGLNKDVNFRLKNKPFWFKNDPFQSIFNQFCYFPIKFEPFLIKMLIKRSKNDYRNVEAYRFLRFGLFSESAVFLVAVSNP